eukprot:7031490-Prymnesium_polylepis.1
MTAAAMAATAREVMVATARAVGWYRWRGWRRRGQQRREGGKRGCAGSGCRGEGRRGVAHAP